MTNPFQYDFVIVGGGLQAGLLVCALRYFQPSSRVLVLEASERLGGNHTWSCHETDLTVTSASWLAGLPQTHWPRYRTIFGKRCRTIRLGYRAIRSQDFARHLAAIAARHPDYLTLQTGVAARSVGVHSVELENGEQVDSQCVVDCRGAIKESPPSRCGFQKFFGWELQLDSDWVNREPTIMDADVPQRDGFRFIYALPFSPRLLLLQDTCFSDNATIEPEIGIANLTRYLRAHGQQNFSVVREEHGCLPMPYGTACESTSDLVRGGYRGDCFHAATGYSMPLAVRFAETIARSRPAEAPMAAEAFRRANHFQATFARLLNRMLFQLVRPESRIQIFRRFYQTLPESLISRFYAHQFSRLDAARLLVGRPPGGLTPIRFLHSYKAS